MSVCYCVLAGEEGVTITFNPTTNETLLLCAVHADRHRNGVGFPVYKESA